MKAALVFVTIVAGASAAQAQTVAMYGEFHETMGTGLSGIIHALPQNPPAIGCVPPPLLVLPPAHLTVLGGPAPQPLDLRPTGAHDARCHVREQHPRFTGATVGVFKKPGVGSRGARIIDNPAGGLAVGDPFTIPPFAFQQQLGLQVGVVSNPNAIYRQLDTSYVAAMPGVDRNGPSPGPLPAGAYTIKTSMQLAPVPALTRMFSAMNWQNPGNGWDNGLAPGGVGARAAANQVVTDAAAGGSERVRVRYAAGPRQFGGTMALLLDGKSRFLAVPPVSGPIFAYRPFAGSAPRHAAGDDAPGFRRRAGIGWNLTIPGVQPPGRFKAFQGNVLTEMGLKPIFEPLCTWMDPLNPLPVGCNRINGFDSYMRGVAPFPSGGTIAVVQKATSVKHVFGFTTGTVSIVVVGLRQGIPYSTTLTGMGYDTVGVSPMGGPQRNVGLVAGAYTVRVSTDTTISPQMLGINLKFTPEPGATAALLGGLGALAVLDQRRRSRMSRSGSRSRGRPDRSS